ncbi:hypothetical protein HG536_0E04900 [Torulaspora globosa]|uniref:Uncharacterized protein n=1 Tax=Torulaspora globosa TaxID=48254 RepID=A0A7G3ZJ93_9SACH|nr:uncharacterized protein HG536_0E04900 [Torulaspora globosa]QLL33579.1 hypothetical protein HG536_0E04900 [Torulaspora globosa]
MEGDKSATEPDREDVKAFAMPLHMVEKDMSFEERKNLLLLNQIIVFILNTSHYMTDLIYALYYLSNCEGTGEVKDGEGQDKLGQQDSNIVDQLSQIRKQLYTLAAQFRSNFRQMLDESNMASLDSAPKFRKLIDRNLICVLGVINELLISEMKSISEPLSMQLHNCLMGFANIYQFLRKVPIHHQYKITKPQLDVLLKALGQELIPSWKYQLDLLNFKLFNLLASHPSIVAQYRDATGDTVSDVRDGPGFKRFVTWLKDEIVGKAAF